MFSDGASRVNPGESGIGIVVTDENDNILKKWNEYIGIATNNQAEYKAILKSLEIIQDIINGSKSEIDTGNWNKRYRENMDKIKSGNIYEVVEVVNALMQRDKEKGLSTGEKKMLSSAKQILISELVLVKNMDPFEIENMIDGFLNH